MSLDESYLKTIVIVGSGPEAYITASSLAIKLKNLPIKITLLDNSSKDDKSSELLALSHHTKSFISWLGINEKHFVRETRAIFNLGQLYKSENASQDFMLDLSDQSITLESSKLSQHLLKRKSLDKSLQLDRYSVSANLARKGKFAPPSNKENSVYSGLRYGYIVNSNSIQTYFEKLARSLNIKIIHDNNATASISENNNVEHINTTQEQLKGEIFIECDKNNFLTALFKDQSQTSFYCDYTKNTESIDESKRVKPHSLIQLHKNQIKRQVKSSTHTYTESFSFADTQKKYPNISNNMWRNNCISLGSSASKLPHFLLPSLEFLQHTLIDLLELWPAGRETKTSQILFNEKSNYILNNYAEIDLYHIQALDLNANLHLPKNSRHRLSLYKEDGLCSQRDNDLLSPENWIHLFNALNFENLGQSRATDLGKQDLIDKQIDSIAKLIEKATDAAPSLSDFYNQYLLQK